MKSIFLPLVNWEMGTLLIVVFAIVCIVLVGIIYNMTQSGQKNTEDTFQDKNE